MENINAQSATIAQLQDELKRVKEERDSNMIDFAEWIMKEDYLPDSSKDYWLSSFDSPDGVGEYTTSQLLDIYKQRKS